MRPGPFTILIDLDTRPFGEDTSGLALVEMDRANGRGSVEVAPTWRLTER